MFSILKRICLLTLTFSLIISTSVIGKSTDPQGTTSTGSLSTEDPSPFEEFTSTLSDNTLYESFASKKSNDLQTLIQNCTEQEHFLLFGLFQYGTCDYLLSRTPSDNSLPACAEEIHRILSLLNLSSYIPTSDDKEALLQLLNQKRSTSCEHLSDLPSTYPDAKKAKKILQMFQTPPETSDAIYDQLSMIFATSDQTKKSKPKPKPKHTDTKDVRQTSTASIRSAASKNYTTTDVGSNKTYKSGSIKIVIKDDVSGKKTSGVLTVSRKTAPSWNTMYDSPTTWDCNLDVSSSDDDHQLSMKQTKVTTVKDINGYYLVMNFQIQITQHAHYVYGSQSHAGSGNGFRLNFESYSQNNDGPGTIIDGIVKEDTVRTINWQINAAALGLKTFDKVRYTDCKSYLTYTRPSHTVTVDPNGGLYHNTKTNTVTKKRTGQWFLTDQIPSHEYSLFQGFQLNGTTYAYQCAGTGMTTDVSSSFRQRYDKNENYTRYIGTKVTKEDSVRFTLDHLPTGHPVLITGQIRINSLPSETALFLYAKNDPTESKSPDKKLEKADGEWQKFELLYTASDTPKNPVFELSPSSSLDAVQFDLKNIIITDQTKEERIPDTNLQLADGKKADVVLTAQWKPLQYKICYNLGLSDKSVTMDPQIQNQDASVSLKTPDYQIPNAVFCGWKYKEKQYQPKDLVSYRALVDIPLKQRKPDFEIDPETIEDKDTFTFTAVWDYLPAITLKNTPAVYIEGEEIAAKQLMSFVSDCADKEDGDLSSQVIIQKIEYQKSNDGYQPKTQTDLTSDTLLDTYYLHLEEDETVQATVTYAVTDSHNNTVTAEKEITIKYNNPPEITASDLSFYLCEIEDTPDQVKEAILHQAKASDLEDEERNLSLTPNVSEPKSFSIAKLKTPGSYSITYSVTDSMKKESSKTITVYVVNEDPYADMKNQTIRFISKKYLNTLQDTSIWNTDSTYHEYLTKTLNKSSTAAEHIYTFTSGGRS